MAANFKIRESRKPDLDVVKDIYSAAFPDEELRPLVHVLFHEKTGVLSLVACIDDVIVGHVVFTMCKVSGETEEVALLGPLAVAPAQHSQGIGSALVLEGRRLLTNDGVVSIYVLGDPSYYSRFGFTPEGQVLPPYPLPKEWRGAWQSLNLKKRDRPLHGKLRVPSAWAEPALWAP
jgi:putative acetyltransferase